jgi:hypothetical protein
MLAKIKIGFSGLVIPEYMFDNEIIERKIVSYRRRLEHLNVNNDIEVPVIDELNNVVRATELIYCVLGATINYVQRRDINSHYGLLLVNKRLNTYFRPKGLELQVVSSSSSDVNNTTITMTITYNGDCIEYAITLDNTLFALVISAIDIMFTKNDAEDMVAEELSYKPELTKNQIADIKHTADKCVAEHPLDISYVYVTPFLIPEKNRKFVDTLRRGIFRCKSSTCIHEYMVGLTSAYTVYKLMVKASQDTTLDISKSGRKQLNNNELQFKAQATKTYNKDNAFKLLCCGYA